VEFHALLRHALSGDVLAAATVAISDYHSPALELLHATRSHLPLLLRAAGLLLCSGCLPPLQLSDSRRLWTPTSVDWAVGALYCVAAVMLTADVLVTRVLLSQHAAQAGLLKLSRDVIVLLSVLLAAHTAFVLGAPPSPSTLCAHACGVDGRHPCGSQTGRCWALLGTIGESALRMSLTPATPVRSQARDTSGCCHCGRCSTWAASPPCCPCSTCSRGHPPSSCPRCPRGWWRARSCRCLETVWKSARRQKHQVCACA
jgi:hypothetical protein